MRTISKFQSILMALCTALCLSACSESNNDEPDGPAKPDEPASGEWQSVPVSGGDVSLDNFTVSLPAGTFDTEKKIAVTKIQARQVCGENEASAFYQVTMPATTLKPITVKVASKDLGEGVSLVMHSESYMTSTGETIPSDVYIETSYEDGVYTATIPEMSNGSNNETLSFAVGVVKVPVLEKDGTRGFLTYDTDLKHGEVEGVKWALYPDPSIAYNDKIWSSINQESHNAIGQYIEESMKILFKMGFKLKKGYGKRVVKFYYKRYYEYYELISNTNVRFKTGDINLDIFGGFEASAISDMESTIGISIDKYAMDKNADWVAPTIIHELFHYFQYDLDNRWQVNKATGIRIDNRSILYEMASVWSEQFMNNGELNSSFLCDHIGKDTKLGLGMEEERIKNAKDVMSEQGYMLGPWLHYLVKEIETQNLQKKKSKHSVCELFDLYAEKWVNGTYNAYPILNEWLESYGPTDANGKSWWNMDDYYLQLFTGNLVKGFNIRGITGSTAPTFSDNFTKLESEGECYSYGCHNSHFMITGYKGIDLSDKELVVKQEKPNLKTYMLIVTFGIPNYTIYKKNNLAFACVQGDSIVLRGNELEALRRSDGTMGNDIFLVTTNITNPKLKDLNTSAEKKASRVTIELRDIVEEAGKLEVSPTLLEFEAEGGEKSITAKKTGYKKMGFQWKETPGWGPSVAMKGEDKIEVRLPENTTSKEREAKLIVWAANKDYSEIDMQKDKCDTVMVTIRQKAGEDGGDGQEKGRFEVVGGRVDMFIQTEYEMGGMGALEFTIGDNIVTMSPNGKGLHFELNWNGNDDKYTDVVQCTFDIDDTELMLQNKASVTNLSWKRKTNNWSGPNGHHWWGIWGGTDFLLRQTQDIAFATAKIQQTGWNEPWDSEYFSANFWAFGKEISPTTCYFHRWSLGQYDDGEHDLQENGDEMLEGSSVSVDLWFKYVEE